MRALTAALDLTIYIMTRYLCFFPQPSPDAATHHDTLWLVAWGRRLSQNEFIDLLRDVKARASEGPLPSPHGGKREVNPSIDIKAGISAADKSQASQAQAATMAAAVVASNNEGCPELSKAVVEQFARQVSIRGCGARLA